MKVDTVPAESSRDCRRTPARTDPGPNYRWPEFAGTKAGFELMDAMGEGTCRLVNRLRTAASCCRRWYRQADLRGAVQRGAAADHNGADGVAYPARDINGCGAGEEVAGA